MCYDVQFVMFANICNVCCNHLMFLTLYPVENENCGDFKDGCADMKEKGLCETDMDGPNNCRNTCGVCPGAG